MIEFLTIEHGKKEDNSSFFLLNSFLYLGGTEMEKENLLSINLKKYREENKLTQLQLAELLEVSDKSISKWELGEVYPSKKNIIKIAELLNISIESLLIENTEEETKNSNLTINKKLLFLSIAIAAILIISSVSLYLSVNQNTQATEKDTSTLTLSTSEVEVTPIEQGIITSKDIKELAQIYFPNEDVYSIKFDGNNYFITGSEKEEHITYKLSKYDFSIEQKVNEVSKNEKDEKLKLNYLANISDIKQKVSINSIEIFKAWELKNYFGKDIYNLDSGELMDAETLTLLN